MRKSLILCLVFGFIACTRNANTNQTGKDTSVTETVAIKSTTQKELDKAPVIHDYPADTVYDARIIIPGGVFHEDEVDPKSAEYAWMGLFKNDIGYYLAPTQVNLARSFDAVLDNEEKKTGWTITPSVKDSAICLISGVKNLQAQPIDSIPLPKKQLLPGEQIAFRYKSVSYVLSATGHKTLEKPNADSYAVTAYKLTLEAIINGERVKQKLVSISRFDDTMTNIYFAGDIDGDDIPDFIIDTTNHYNVSQPTLYLSKPATKGNLLKVMGMHVSVGC
ncbi:hypothetical protein ABDD95_19850 [Mucilaginibacter sp. PAMB04274]|uniref:hypothetical protein n=1 Tax=Mucilaginibacter sp. PAMB04274 TaxID=3138568 RepID=UPI0031F6DE03